MDNKRRIKVDGLLTVQELTPFGWVTIGNAGSIKTALIQSGIMSERIKRNYESQVKPYKKEIDVINNTLATGYYPREHSFYNQIKRRKRRLFRKMDLLLHETLTELEEYK